MVLLYFGGRVKSLAALALCRDDLANSFVDSRLDRHLGKLVSLLRHQGGAMDERGYTTQITAMMAYSLRPLNPLSRFANLEWLLT